jgi:glycosyltransferase involved in cell wall biosynthesis
MMRVFVNALAASAGGGLTYVRNVVPHLEGRDDVRATVLVSHLADELTAFPNVTIIKQDNGAGPAVRFWHEQSLIPRLLKKTRADVLINTGNFAVWICPIPQILLSRNALYISKEFQRDVHGRGDRWLWLDNNIKGALARASIARAECTVAPSQAFADELERWAGRPVKAIHHGFDPELFLQNGKPVPQQIQAQLQESKGALRLLFVSHYNYYRNFSTLLRALPLLKERLSPRKVKLILTCSLETNDNRYRPRPEAALIAELGIAEDVIQLGAVSYDLLHHLYAAADMYVSSAYAESFAHPLVEAMASGLPLVVSDLAVHREICQDAALYFTPFSPEDLARRVSELATSPDLLAQMRHRGQERGKDFSWKRHVNELLELAVSLVNAQDGRKVAFSVPEPR